MSNKEKTKPTGAGGPAEEAEQGDAPDAGTGAGTGDSSTHPGAEQAGTADDTAEAPELTLEEQLGEMTDRWMRSRADTENVRRRARLDVEEARKHGAANLIQSMLPVLDSLQRALSTKPEAGTESGDDKVWEGLELTEQMLMGTLAAQGVTPIDAHPGAPFDPKVHQALLEQPTEEQEPGTIVMELVRGYRLHDRLLREAQVTVATRPSGPSGDSTPGVPGQPGSGQTPGEDDPHADV